MAIKEVKDFGKKVVKEGGKATAGGILGAAAHLPESVLSTKKFAGLIPKVTKFCSACGGLPGFLLGCAVTHVGTTAVCKGAKAIFGSKEQKQSYPEGGSKMSDQQATA